MIQAPPPNAERLLVRWTIGDVRERGFEMLRLSIACAFGLFGPQARYIVCVNTVSAADAQTRSGPVPAEVEWRQVTRDDVPGVVRSHLGEHLIEGMGWKLVPLRLCPERFELAIDNDCIVWALPEGMRKWLEREDAFLFAEDVERYLGSFDALCPPGAFNAGIRGLPPYYDLAGPLETVLARAEELHGGVAFEASNEIEEQGLQAAAIHQCSPLYLVRTSEVSICSPFWPRMAEPGTCGVHLVGMNAAHIPWDYFDRPADEWLSKHWERLRPELYRRAGLPI